MKELIILVGNVGTGKSTFAKNNFDPNLYHVIEPDKVLSEENKKNDDFLRLLIETAINEHDRIVIDGNNLTKSVRTHYGYYKRLFDCKLIAYDFGAGDDNSLTARVNDPKGESMEFWVNKHNENIRIYEKPSIDEFFDVVYEVHQGEVINCICDNSGEGLHKTNS